MSPLRVPFTNQEFLESFSVVINGFEYWPSPKLNKKLATRVVGHDGIPKIIHFGNSCERHYDDKSGYFSDLDHNDNKLRYEFYKKHKKTIDEGLEEDSELFHEINVFW